MLQNHLLHPLQLLAITMLAQTASEMIEQCDALTPPVLLVHQETGTGESDTQLAFAILAATELHEHTLPLANNSEEALFAQMRRRAHELGPGLRTFCLPALLGSRPNLKHPSLFIGSPRSVACAVARQTTRLDDFGLAIITGAAQPERHRMMGLLKAHHALRAIICWTSVRPQNGNYSSGAIEAGAITVYPPPATSRPPTLRDIRRMNYRELDQFLNRELSARLPAHRFRRPTTDQADSAALKTAMRALGFRCEYADTDSGCAARFSFTTPPATPRLSIQEATEEAAIARAAAFALIFNPARPAQSKNGKSASSNPPSTEPAAAVCKDVEVERCQTQTTS